jgi:hypothetical protein
MLVFIHSSFKLDLTYLNVTFTEQNQWFKDDFSTEISFPFDLYLDSELSKNSGFQDHYNANNNQTSFSGILDKDGEIGDAILTFQGLKGKVISAIINAGLDNFPSFDKKLAELLLEKKLVSDIVANANSVITQGYPAVNYNFPMIHTAKYDPTTPDWNGFGKIINNYTAGSFLSNIMVENNIDEIKNIMQPLPYLMHVVKTGIENAGYTLEGDILNDSDFNRALIFRDGNYYKKTSKEEIPFVYLNNQWDALAYINNGFQYVTFTKEITITKKGDYRLSGDVNSLVYSQRGSPDWLNNRHRCSKLDYDIDKVSQGVMTSLYGEHWGKEENGRNNLNVEVHTQSIDIPVSFEVGDILRITKTEPRRDYNPSITPDNPEAVSLRLTPTRYKNSDGSPILTVLNLNEIDLTKVVPDMTFRELIMILKNWKNYEFAAKDNVISMNLIENKLNRLVAKDISENDIEEPKRDFRDDRVYELSFADGKANETYRYDSVLIDKDGFTVTNYTEKSTTSPIKIDALPLPVVTKNGINTAYSYEDETSKLRIVFMNPVYSGTAPVSFLNKNVLIPNIYENNYKKWLDFRINSIAWNWEFIISVEKFREITIQSLIYAYSNYHVLAEIEKERLDKSWWRIVAKTESLL